MREQLNMKFKKEPHRISLEPWRRPPKGYPGYLAKSTLFLVHWVALNFNDIRSKDAEFSDKRDSTAREYWGDKSDWQMDCLIFTGPAPRSQWRDNIRTRWAAAVHVPKNPGLHLGKIRTAEYERRNAPSLYLQHGADGGNRYEANSEAPSEATVRDLFVFVDLFAMGAKKKKEKKGRQKWAKWAPAGGDHPQRYATEDYLIHLYFYYFNYFFGCLFSLFLSKKIDWVSRLRYGPSYQSYDSCYLIPWQSCDTKVVSIKIVLIFCTQIWQPGCRLLITWI